jgi:hypothetical protein
MDTQSDQQQQATDEATLAAAAKNEGKLDLLLHLERFSNIDIFRRGYYQVSVELTHKNSDGTAVHYATCIPYRPQPPQEQCGKQSVGNEV